MKITSLLAALCITAILLSSCSGGYRDTVGVVTDFSSEYGIGGSIYSSLAKEGEEGYIDGASLSAIFHRTDILPADYTLLLHSDLESVFELGVFLSNSAERRLKLAEICLDRINLLESFSDGEGEVMIKDNLLIYFFSSDRSGVKECLKRVLS